MNRLILSIFTLAFLTAISYGQSPYAGCGCQQPRRQIMAMGSIPAEEAAAMAAAAAKAYRAWNTPEARIARQAIGTQWRSAQRARQIQADASRMQAARAELAWKLRMGYAQTAAAPG